MKTYSIAAAELKKIIELVNNKNRRKYYMAKHNPYEYTDFESIIQYFHKLQRGFQR